MNYNNDFVFVTDSDLDSADMVKADFSRLEYPRIEKIAKWQKWFLELNGFKAVEDSDNLYIVAPKELKYVDVTAPVYNMYNGEYVKIFDSYTESWADPYGYEESYQIVNKILTMTEGQKEEIFLDIFRKNSLDGRIAVLHLWSGYTIYGNSIPDSMIPDNIIRVCCFDSNVCLMTPINCNGGGLTLKVKDSKYIPHLIGRSGKNIKRLKTLINANQINVV